MIVYKLLNQDMQSYGGCLWKLGEKKTTCGYDELCGPDWLYAYEHPLLAVLHNPIHADMENPRLFEADTGDGRILRNGQLKLGTTELMLIREIPLPKITTTQHVAYGIYCALAVYDDSEFKKWASSWLNNTDRLIETSLLVKWKVCGAAEWEGRARAAARAARAAVRAAEAWGTEAEAQSATAALEAWAAVECEPNFIKCAQKAMLIE